MNSSKDRKRVAIIGGGISGLSAAQYLTRDERQVDVTLFEASSRLGGVIRTTRQDGFTIEHSADSFIVSPELPWAGQLCEQLQLPLLATSAENRGAWILRNGLFHPIPAGLQLMSVRQWRSIWSTPLLSWQGKLRASLERFIPARTSGEEESLESFAVRRFGREMFERIIQPLVAGIYTADPQKLSLRAALPQFAIQEEKHGSLARAAAASSSSATDSGARYSLFRSPELGMDGLINTLHESLKPSVNFRLATSVDRVSRASNQWQVELENEALRFDAVLCANSATTTAPLLGHVSTVAAEELTNIEHVSTAVVCLGFARDQIAHRLNAFGCVIPAIENRRILAISFTNLKFPNRAPEGHVLLRVFVGGALQPELAELDDVALLKLVRDEVEQLLGTSGQPVSQLIVRWPKTTPQYHLGHIEQIQRLEKSIAELPGLEIAGNAFHGVGIPQCVRSGWDAAGRLLDALFRET